MTDTVDPLRSWNLPITKTTILELDELSVLIRSDGQRFPVLSSGGIEHGYLSVHQSTTPGFSDSWRYERRGEESLMSYATAEGALRGLHEAESRSV